MSARLRVPAFLRNADIRLAALLLAVLLWFHAVTEKQYRVTLRCPVEISNVPDGWAVSGRPPAVSCEVTATGKQIIALRISPPVIAVDAANRQVKRLLVDLTPARLRFPYRISPRRVDFAAGQLVVAFDRLASKTVRVAVDLRGEPAEGHLVGDSLSVAPPTVELRGPQKLLDAVDSVYTTAVGIDGASAPLSTVVRLVLPDTPLCSVAPDSVLVTVPFERSGERLFRNVPVRLANRGSGYLVSFSPGTIDVAVAGPNRMLAAADPAQIRAVLDLKNLERGQFRLQASIELPAKLELLAASPRDFDVSIR